LGYDQTKFAWRDGTPESGVVVYTGFQQSNPVQASMRLGPDGLQSGDTFVSYAPQNGSDEALYNRLGGSVGFSNAALAWAQRDLASRSAEPR
jgi:hypothetical protein